MSDDLERARLLLDVGRADQACARLAAHLASEPHDVDALCLLAEAQADLGRAEDAVRTAEAAVALAPDDEQAHRALGHAQLRAERYGESVGTLQEAVRLDPDDWHLRALLAHALVRTRDVRSAWYAANEAVRLAPQESDAHGTVAVVALAADWLPQAELALREALRLDPTSVSATYNLGMLQEKEGALVAATERFLDSARLAPGDADSGQRIVELCWQMLLVCAVMPLLAAAGPLFALRGGDEDDRLTLVAAVPIVLVLAAAWALRGLSRLSRPVRRVLRRQVLLDPWGLACCAALSAGVAVWCVIPFRPLSDAREIAGALALSGLVASGSAVVGYVRA